MIFTSPYILALATLAMRVLALDLPNYRAIRTSLIGGVLNVTFHNPDWPQVNFWGQSTQDEMTDLVERLHVDNETKVVVFSSDVPRFFIAHLDTSIFASPGGDEFIFTFANLLYNITTLPQVTIGAIEGRARGAGAEFLSSLDMRFATTVDTLIGAPEVSAGLIPGGGGGVLLASLVGRAQAMEYVLSARDVTASEAERLGWINRAFETSAELHAHINLLTSRIRLFPLISIQAAKEMINRVARPSFEDFYAEAMTFTKVTQDPLVQQVQATSNRILGSMDLLEVELTLPDWVHLFFE
ncbi:ClpP/crotonase-like domain-containing protein [Plectosphaerella plurivora]|uniref:ClpP/crotonase-like domain-containing protein n=1 Tax=Plectosphaerella plurivora TaxID=936078 RepID=A0A9P8VNI8_9PEZI|nr:ClpP/crotonase-like domain-containing protein [Plectosphaerella plurivora]